MRNMFTVFLIIQFLCVVSYSQPPIENFYNLRDIKADSKGNEFISGASSGQSVFIKVNIWGAVNKPGIHFVPPKTNLINLLSYAGGPKDNSNIEEVTLRRQLKNREEILTLNLKTILEGDDRNYYILEPDDIIMIPSVEPAISNNTLMSVGFVTSVLSIVMAGFILSDRVQGN
jgi:hypothetical protein